jgi:hypothetical protein
LQASQIHSADKPESVNSDGMSSKAAMRTALQLADRTGETAFSTIREVMSVRSEGFGANGIVRSINTISISIT